MHLAFRLITAAAFLLLGFYFYLVIGGMISPPEYIFLPPSENAQSYRSAPKAPSTSEYSTQQLTGFPEGANLAEGERLFKANCASCHHPIKALTGPALGGSWDKFQDDRTFLYAWVRNAPEMIAQGDPKAVDLSQWGPGMMLAFPSLTDVQIASILGYAEEMTAPIAESIVSRGKISPLSIE